MTTPEINQSPKVLRRLETISRLGISKSTFSDWQNPKSKRYRPDFPKKIKLGANSVGYLESEINAFIQSLADSRTA
ncbi:Transcriptional regulator, AlpA [Bibersteinia trehalosi USDA-ARS-USMARC-190]|uniref:Transcriptional regulator, AlpA n=1 Tax=Bibersteinia trehalosi USDA-ARS-USMARC-190 TaxID=1263832 RepID=W0RAG6_BIBTR|nr:Transcriptional regulator, AlpA [Bibersteinia trehalosi USDA-ARS-USMARC-190]